MLGLRLSHRVGQVFVLHTPYCRAFIRQIKVQRGRRGALGISEQPVISGLTSIHWVRSGSMQVGAYSGPRVHDDWLFMPALLRSKLGHHGCGIICIWIQIVFFPCLRRILYNGVRYLRLSPNPPSIRFVGNLGRGPPGGASMLFVAPR